MTDSTTTSPSVLILGGDETERLVTAALQELPVRVVRFQERNDFARTPRSSDLVILERERLDGPGDCQGWIEGEILDPTVPLLLFSAAPVKTTEYRDWLAAGIWETVNLPLDPTILGLRLRNLLGARLKRHRPPLMPNRPYPWLTLVRATGEVLALGRRHHRPVACVALAVELPGSGDADREPAKRLMSRLGVAAREWVRDSDLLGLTEQDVLLVVLPDTTGHYAGILGPRLLAALQRSLNRAGTVATLRSATRVATMDGSESAADFLLGAVRQLS